MSARALPFLIARALFGRRPWRCEFACIGVEQPWAYSTRTVPLVRQAANDAAVGH